MSKALACIAVFEVLMEARLLLDPLLLRFLLACLFVLACSFAAPAGSLYLARL